MVITRWAFLCVFIFGWAGIVEAQQSSATLAAITSDAYAGRERINFDADWRFALGHATDRRRDFDFDTGYFSYLAKTGYGDGPTSARFDDRAWRKIDLPHDWALELPFSERASASHGFRAVGKLFPEQSVGWYRKTFDVPASDLGRRIHLTLDGVYREAQVFVNGFFVGREPSGYTGADYDLTDYINYNESNTVAVRVDASEEEGWFYEGAGIYRHVWLTKTAPLHVAREGTFVRTVSIGETAEISSDVQITSEIANESFQVSEAVIDGQGRRIAEVAPQSTELAAGLSEVLSNKIRIPQAKLWSVDEPNLYRLVTTLHKDGREVDRFVTVFGIRTAVFDPNHGFFLNGQHVVIKGSDNHQDHAGLGVALPDALQEFRIRRLKEMGSNAYRCSHNPPTPEFLDACDRLGLLVLDENRLMGSNEYHFDHLERMIRRDRNHPSVVLWSLGNEEWAIEGHIAGTRIAKTMQDFAHRLDPSRLCTVAISGGREHGISASIDVMGYNYISQGSPDDHRAIYPQQPGVGTEETTTQGTRGIYKDDPTSVHLAPMENGTSGGNCESGWQYYASHPYLAGLFFWTGFDYRGEPTPFGWPAVSSQFGIVDTCGFPKDSFYYLKAWWGREPLVHISRHWNWAGQEGQLMDVRVESNCETVELWLNQRSLGRKSVPKNGHVNYNVSYEPGSLLARGYSGQAETARDLVETAGAPTEVKLSVDREKLRADAADAAVVTVSVLDGQGRVVPVAQNKITFHVDGPGRIIGVGNGDPNSHEPDQYKTGLELRAVSDWRGKIVSAGEKRPSLGATLPPISVLGNWKAILPKAGENYAVTASFSLEATPAEARYDLFLPSWGRETSVWVNGHLLGEKIDTTKTGPEFSLEKALLTTGANRIEMLVIPFADGRNHIPEQSRNGTVRISLPAPPWQRSVFNGYAQVIVQTKHEAGDIILTASGDGLKEGTVVLKSSN